MRHALELSITVAPRFAASGASAFEVSAAGAEQRDVDAVERVGRRQADLRSVPVATVTRPAGGPLGREQAQLRDRELLLEQDLGHRPADGAGGADDGDDRANWGWFQAWSDLLADGLSGTGGSIPAGPRPDPLGRMPIGRRHPTVSRTRRRADVVELLREPGHTSRAISTNARDAGDR